MRVWEGSHTWLPNGKSCNLSARQPRSSASWKVPSGAPSEELHCSNTVALLWGSRLPQPTVWLPRVRAGALYSAADYLQAQRVRTLVQQEVAQVMREVDALITPTSSQPADRFDEFDPLSSLRRSLTRFVNFTGMPAISLCCGFTASGFPIGLQIAGRAFDEANVLPIAYTYERNTSWRQRRPPL